MYNHFVMYIDSNINASGREKTIDMLKLKDIKFLWPENFRRGNKNQVDSSPDILIWKDSVDFCPILHTCPSGDSSDHDFFIMELPNDINKGIPLNKTVIDK